MNTGSEQMTQRLAFIPDQEDLEFLARAYLEKAIGLHWYYFYTGGCDGAAEAMRLTARFEDVANCLGEGKRREIIDTLDEHEARANGDSWQAFKATCDGFWSTPANHDAILRLAASLPDDLSELDIGPDYFEVLEQARFGSR